MVKRVFTVVHRGVRSSAGQRVPASAGKCREVPRTLIHCACAVSLIPQFEFCRMSQSLVVGNCLAAVRGCAFLLHLSVTRNQDPFSFECLSSRAHFSSFLVNVSAPGCPVHRILLCLCIDSNFASAMVIICCARQSILRASFAFDSLQPVQLI